MTIITTTSCPPLIDKFYSQDLLSRPIRTPLNHAKKMIEKAIEKSKKKIRPQDTRKKREFDELLKQFEVLHGWKTDEKNDYDRKRKEMYEKVSNNGGSVRFKRFTEL